MAMITQHEDQCPYRPHKCPFGYAEVACSSEGPVDDIASHIQGTHICPEYFKATGQYRNQLPDMEPSYAWCQAVFAMNEVFFHVNETQRTLCIAVCSMWD
jgi:hypothetical protein